MFISDILRFSLEEPHETIKKISSGEQPRQLLEVHVLEATEKSMEFYRSSAKSARFLHPMRRRASRVKIDACVFKVRHASRYQSKQPFCVFHEFISADSSLPDNDGQRRGEHEIHADAAECLFNCLLVPPLIIFLPLLFYNICSCFLYIPFNIIYCARKRDV